MNDIIIMICLIILILCALPFVGFGAWLVLSAIFDVLDYKING